jgi:hypothetical protein
VLPDLDLSHKIASGKELEITAMLKSASMRPLAALLLALASCSGDSGSPAEPDQPVAIALAGNGSGGVTSSPAGIACTLTNGQQGGTCAATFEPGTTVTLTATAGTGSVFQAWGSGCSGSGSCSLSMSGPRSVTAQFTQTSFALTLAGGGNGTGIVTSNPAGIVCDLANGQASGQCSAQFPAGTSVTLRAVAGANSSLAGWSGACSGTGTCAVTLDAAKSVTATLALVAYPVVVTGQGAGTGTVTSSPAGISCTVTNGVTSGTCSANFTSGANVILTAAPNASSDFTGWFGFCGGTGNCTLEVTGNRTVIASFGVKSFTFSVNGAGAGAGTVTSSPAGINCTLSNGTGSGTCSAGFAAGTQVTLSRSVTGLNVFDGWSGACTGTGACVVTMDQTRTVTATFSVAIQNFTITVSPAGNGSGSVASTPAGINCTVTNGVGSGSCSASFAAGTSLQLTASATAPNSFGGWSGACTGTAPCLVLVVGNATINATFNFVAPTQPLVVSGSGTGSGTVTSSPAGINCTVSGGIANGACSFSFAENAAVTLTAAATGGGSFSGWSGACAGTGTCQVTMSAPRAVTASFTAPPPAFAISPDFLVLANGAGSTLTSTLGGTTLLARNPAVLAVSGLQVTGQSVGVTDVVGTNGGNTDSSRVAVVPLDGFAVIATAAQTIAFNTVGAGATIGLDLWLLKPTGGTVDFGSIQGSITWDPGKYQYVSFSTSSGALADSWSVTPNTSGTGTGSLQYAAFSASGTTGSFALARLTLRAIGSGTGSVTPTVSAASNASTATIPAGKIVPVASGLRIP